MLLSQCLQLLASLLARQRTCPNLGHDALTLRAHSLPPREHLLTLLRRHVLNTLTRHRALGDHAIADLSAAEFDAAGFGAPVNGTCPHARPAKLA